MSEQGRVYAGATASLGIPLALCSISGVMAAVVMVPIMPEIFRAFGNVPNASFWLPALVTIPGLCSALLSPVAGYIGDKVGLKWPIVICLCFYALFGVAPLVLHEFQPLLGSRVALGISLVGVLVLSIAMIGQQFEGRAREKWLSIQAAAASSSTLVLLPLSGLLASSPFRWRGSFLIYLSALILAVALARQPIRARAGSDHEEDGAASAQMPWRWLIGQCVITSLCGTLFFSTQLQLGLALATVGVKDAGTIGLLSGITAVGIVIGAMLFMKAKQLFGAAILPLELLVMGITLILMWQFQSVPALIGLAFVNLLVCGLMLPTLVTVVSAGLPDSNQGRGLGLWNSAFTLAQFFSSAVIGLVLARGLTVLDAFGILGVSAILLAAFVTANQRATGMISNAFHDGITKRGKE